MYRRVGSAEQASIQPGMVSRARRLCTNSIVEMRGEVRAGAPQGPAWRLTPVRIWCVVPARQAAEQDHLIKLIERMAQD